MPGRVLIVDDAPANRRLLSRFLRKAGYETSDVGDGATALRRVREDRPDLVFLDVVMPGMDGYEVCRHLKSDPECSSIPVIFLSGIEEVECKVRAFEAGAADYITKPFDQGEVIARARSQLEIRELTSSLREANEDLRKKQEQIERDLCAAADIQKSLIPRVAPDIPNLRAAWRFVPCDAIGGDIFNIVRLDENTWSIYMVDVSGHGVPAAMVTVSLSQMLSSAGVLKKAIAAPPHYAVRRPDELFVLLDEEYPFARFEKFFTMGYAVYDSKTRVLEYSNAAHPSPMLIRNGGDVEQLDAGGTIIGLGNVVPFEVGTTKLEVGDRLFLYTDGVVEVANSHGEYYGLDRLSETLIGCTDLGIEETCDVVMCSVNEFGRGLSQPDDLTLLALECTE